MQRSPHNFPSNFVLSPELYEMKRDAWHKRTVAVEELIPELHRLLDAWATLYANLAAFKLGPTHYDLDELGIFGQLAWWLGYTDHEISTKLLRESFVAYCKSQGTQIRGAWGKIYLIGDNKFMLSTSGIQTAGYENPLVTAIMDHTVSA